MPTASEATRTWLRISLRTFGGPAGQIAVMHRELVETRRWIGERRFLHALSYCTLLPGPEAQQLAIYLGWLLHGTRGGLIAGSLFVLPGYLAIMALSAIYVEWGTTTVVTAMFAGLAPAVLAIVAGAVRRLARKALTHRFLVALAVAAFFALFVGGVPFPVVIGCAALGSWMAHRYRPTWLRSVAADSSTKGEPASLIADDASQTGSVSAARGARIVAVGLVMWLAPVAFVGVVLGREHVFVEQGLFFSGTAIVTFGGAYAVLSFVAQRAVEVYGWLAPGEMVRGLALAETTPGPLIMVVQFVAFLGAFRQPGTLNPWLAAVVGSTLVVWVTFVPSFVFVFLGAPYIERLRSNVRLSAALAGVTAAVVGVIANLSLYFAIHTLFDSTRPAWAGLELPVWSSLDWRAVLVAAVAFVLTFRLTWDVLKVLGICALVGAVLHLTSL